MSLPDLSAIVPFGAAAHAVHLAPDDPCVHALFAATPLPARLSSAVPKRRLQFAAGRHCARLAMERLGLVGEDLLTADAENVPSWPADTTGSISHTDDVAWAVAARLDAVAGLGVDVERVIPPERAERLARFICSPEEIALGTRTGEPLHRVLTLAFSAKEALFKCVYPLVRTRFDYRDARLTGFGVDGGRLRLTLEIDLDATFVSGTVFGGRFTRTGTHVYTCVWLAADFCGASANTPDCAGVAGQV